MSNALFTLLVLLGTNLLLYILIVLTPYFSTADTYMGVYLEAKYRQTPEAKRIFKTFLFYTTVTFLLTSLILVLLLLKLPDLSHSPLLVLILTAETLFYLFIYARGYEQTKAYKKGLNLPQPTGGKLLIDTAFMEQKNKIKLFYKKLLFIPVIIGIFLVVYTLYHYPQMPELIPIHFNGAGEIDGWTSKNIVTALLPSGLTVLITFLLSYTLDATFNKRGQLSKEHLEEEKNILLKYLKWNAISLLLLMFAISFMMISIVFATVAVSPLNPLYMILSIVAIILSIILMGYHSYCYKRDFPRTQDANTYLPPEEQDEFWLWGIFYNNPNDPAVLVTKRHGMGWTINIGSPKGKWITLALVVSIIVAIFSSVL